MIIKILKSTPLNFLDKKQFKRTKNAVEKKFLFFKLQRDLFIAKQAFEFSFLIEKEQLNLTIPVGSEVNGKNTLKILSKIIKSYNTGHDEIYAVHDFLYSIKYINKNYKKPTFIDKEIADLILFQMLINKANEFNGFISRKIKIIQAYIEYTFVKFFGNFYYKGIDHER
jgi:hypothetical protein